MRSGYSLDTWGVLSIKLRITFFGRISHIKGHRAVLISALVLGMVLKKVKFTSF